MFTYTAQQSGYFQVMLNGVVLSRHTAEREAIENANDAKLANPDADVRYSHDYEVVVGLTEQPQVVDAVVGQAVNVTLRSSDPNAVSISGQISVTPLAETDVELVPEVVP